MPTEYGPTMRGSISTAPLADQVKCVRDNMYWYDMPQMTPRFGAVDAVRPEEARRLADRMIGPANIEALLEAVRSVAAGVEGVPVSEMPPIGPEESLLIRAQGFAAEHAGEYGGKDQAAANAAFAESLRAEMREHVRDRNKLDWARQGGERFIRAPGAVRDLPRRGAIALNLERPASTTQRRQFDSLVAKLRGRRRTTLAAWWD